MDRVESLHSLDQIKLLADPRRLAILRLLMASPATLTQLALTLAHSPAWVRHHILALEAAHLVEIAEIRTRGKVTEKYYRARAAVFLLQEMIFPKTRNRPVVFSGSNDLAIEGIASHLKRNMALINFPVGSLEGLINLRHGFAQVSGTHLLDVSGEYNAPYVRHFFPDESVELVTLAYRTQGLMLAPANPKHIRSLADLTRKPVRLANRNSGSGTRVWFDQQLKRLGIASDQIRGYQTAFNTHSETALAVQNKRADAALGLQAAAAQHGLDFIPLFQERYDLVFRRSQERQLAPLLDYLQTSAFRQALHALPGYATAHSGEQIPL